MNCVPNLCSSLVCRYISDFTIPQWIAGPSHKYKLFNISFTMPAGTQQRERSQSQRMELQGTPNTRVSLRKQVSSSRQLATSQTQVRGRPQSSDAHPSSARRAYSLAQYRSTSKTPPHRNTLIVKQYAQSVQSDNDLCSVSSDSNLNTNERRQPGRSSRSERSFRDDSPGKKTSINKGSASKLSSERVVVIQRVVEGEFVFQCD